MFNGWNVFQVQNLGLYSEIVDENGTVTTECSICAGTATEDGNDACVNVNVDLNLEVGDYVMIVNSTSIPPLMVYISQAWYSRTESSQICLTEQCGNAIKYMCYVTVDPTTTMIFRKQMLTTKT